MRLKVFFLLGVCVLMRPWTRVQAGTEVSDAHQPGRNVADAWSSEFGRAPASRRSRKSAVMLVIPAWLWGGTRPGRPVTLGCPGSICNSFQFRNFVLNFKY